MPRKLQELQAASVTESDAALSEHVAAKAAGAVGNGFATFYYSVKRGITDGSTVVGKAVRDNHVRKYTLANGILFRLFFSFASVRFL